MSTKLGIATVKCGDAEISLEAGFSAALKIHKTMGADIAQWIPETMMYVDKNGGEQVSRMGLAEVFYLLQTGGEERSLEDIYETFFSDPNMFTSEYLNHLLEAIAYVTGAEYQKQIVEATANDDGPEKKIPSV